MPPVGHPDRKCSRRLEVAMQSVFQEKFSYIMVGSVIVRRMRAFAVAAASANSSATSLPGMPL